MFNEALATLRDRSAPTAAFRQASDVVCTDLINQLSTNFHKKNIDVVDVVFVFVLRAALAFLHPATTRFPSAKVGFAGLRRNEETAEAEWYYERLPALSPHSIVVICDPMLATGGSASETAQKLLSLGVAPSNLFFVGVIGAPEGLEKLSALLPKEQILLGALDPGLDSKKFIVPGLGDFGDRYFGTV